MSQSEEIANTLRERLGLDIESISLTRGGDINDAFRAETPEGPIFVKTSPTAQAGMFTAEAAGLEWLADGGAISTPRIIGVNDPLSENDGPRLLALEWIDEGAPDPERLGRELASMHALGAPHFGFTPGPQQDAPMRFNDLSLPNDPLPTFAEFYASNRIIPLTEESVARGRMSVDSAKLMETLAAKLPDLAGPHEPPARTHGDLWLGNVIGDRSGKPILIDPVAHGGHREVDLANLKVFGSPGQRCFDAYDEVAPLAEGHEDRVALWQLAMILLHVYLFGGGYEGQAVAIAKRYI